MQIPAAIRLALVPAPLFLVEAGARKAFEVVLARHPSLVDRLGAYAERTFGFASSDLPFAFVVTPRPATIRVVRSIEPGMADACAEGPIVRLLALLEGRVDGDALFFARDIVVSGDMEAMLALRNALDDCEVDLPTDLAGIAGPAGPLVKRAFERIRTRLLDPTTWN
ncbi:SCP2 sterol-binding domain-containing protein [Alsobacter sp. SYSU M60028]|uniref:SCP2 sterol-binding domain-containing protein n=1 Tax=Alsobacter ponti TaxID=2962936 RepID=A0ABT1L8K9_9HYPH|nr:SCP2 sterol-binding domain-containing protein [Alsobacter ponti]MCP8937406.1 SCP2 sterol-binding domain-containing protein [Alsobacter ponti]